MRKKRTISRKRFALRWFVLLVVLVLGLVLSGIYRVLPTQSLPALLQEKGLTKTEVIHYERGKYSPMGEDLLMVSQNETAIVLSSTYFRPATGWSSGSIGAVFLKGEEEENHFSWTARKNHGDSLENSRWVCLFGFVPTGGEAPTYKFGLADWNANSEVRKGERSAEEFIVLGDTYFVEEPVTVTPKPTIPVRGGMLYLEQYFYEVDDDADEWNRGVEVIMERDGQWDRPPKWMSSSVMR